MYKLNLGCGDNLLEGYVNIDKYDKAADVRLDITNLDPYADKSVDEIVAYQVIEHVPYNESNQMFREMHRVLKPGGFAIVETPDIEYVARAILKEGLEDKWIWNLVGQYYRPWDKERYDDWEMNAASIHRNPWTFERLRRVCEPIGFRLERIEEVSQMMSKFEENLAVRLIKL